MKKEKKWFNYVVLAAVLLIPFMYSFFYLKAYWNPYGEGNIDNLPVAVVNMDKGDKGNELINNIKDSKKLKLSIISMDEANAGLNNGDYYAIINIPENFTDSMQSASELFKYHATITYSPNQKSNYLSSQIINTVVLTVEKNLDNAVNSEIVGSLSETIESVPENLETISKGFSDLESGTSKLSDGSKAIVSGTENLTDGITKLEEGSKNLKNGSETLNSKYSEFNSSLKELSDSLNLLQNETSSLSGVNDKLTELSGAVTGLKNGTENLKNSLSQLSAICNNINNDPTATSNERTLCGALYSSVGVNAGVNNLYLNLSGLEQEISKLSTTKTKLEKLQGATVKLSYGSKKLYEASVAIQSGISNVSSGSNELYNGINQLGTGANELSTGIKTLDQGITVLNTSVGSAKKELDNKIKTTKDEVKKVNGLKEYSKEPIKVETEEVNKVSSYGTAFSPLFISIALWVGSLMLFIVLYFDKEQRFGILGIDSNKYIKRTLAYHGLATLSGIVLGLLLQILLDFDITNVLLYYLSIILISNCFLAIIEFLIERFGDIGKFVALIILVLQLGASGGTFPIETVTKGFRFLNPMLPMTYTIKLLKESLISIESKLLTNNLIIVFIIFLVFFIINLVFDYYKQKRGLN